MNEETTSKIEQVRKHYDSVSEEFSRQHLTPQKKRYIETTTLTPLLRIIQPENKVILDLGCAHGWLADYLTSASHIHGIDISPRMINLANRLHGASNRTYEVMNAAQMQFDDNTFDGIVCLGLFEYLTVPEFSPWLREICRVLRPGGHFLFTAYGSNYLLRLLARSAPTLLRLLARSAVTDGVSFLALNPRSDVENLIAAEPGLTFESAHVAAVIPTNIAGRNRLFCSAAIWLNGLADQGFLSSNIASVWLYDLQKAD